MCQVYYLFQVLHVFLYPLCFVRDSHQLCPDFDSPALDQRWGVRRWGKHCMVGWNWVVKRKKQPVFLLVDQERSHSVQHCQTRVNIVMTYFMLSFMVFSILYAWLFSENSAHKFTSCAEPARLCLKCMCFTYYIYVHYECVCLAKRVRCFAEAHARGGRQRKTRPQRGWKWE